MEAGLVRALEVATCTARDSADRSVAGFALFVLLSRARLTDAARADGNPVLDLDDLGKGYVEVLTSGLKVKTGRGKRRRLRLLPLVANATGLTQRPWAQRWLAARQECGQDAARDGCLQQALGPFGFRPGTVMGTVEVMAHVRRLLRATGAPDALLRDKTSHSLKATCLSWAAKAGLPLATRRVLGGHARPGDISVLEYSRDALSGPLRELDGVLAKISAGPFDPDQTRSGRWSQDEPAGEGSESDAPTEGRLLGCGCGSAAEVASRLRYKGAGLWKCADCGLTRAEFDAWTGPEQEAWAASFLALERSFEASDADSEREVNVPQRAPVESGACAASDVSSSDSESLPADAEPGTDEDAVATLGAAALVKGDASDASDTTDEEEAWVNPMYWDFGLARHAAWFTVHAVAGNDRLLCGRVIDQNFERIVNPPDAYPVCRVCRARVRGRVEEARKRGLEGRPPSQRASETDCSGRESDEFETPGTSPGSQRASESCDY